MTDQKTRRARVAEAFSPSRWTPEHTRQATRFERHTVTRISQKRLLQVHSWLELLGRVTLVVYCAFIATLVLGVDWKHTVESALNAGRPIKGAIVLAVVVPTLLFVALRSAIGYMRWRVQRELWRRDVQRLSGREQSSP